MSWYYTVLWDFHISSQWFLVPTNWSKKHWSKKMCYLLSFLKNNTKRFNAISYFISRVAYWYHCPYTKPCEEGFRIYNKNIANQKLIGISKKCTLYSDKFVWNCFVRIIILELSASVDALVLPGLSFWKFEQSWNFLS